MKGCPFCEGEGGTVLFRGEELRVVLADEPLYPGFLRVIWNDHVAEMTDLNATEKGHMMRAVFACESGLRRLLSPDKINLASFGNHTPHLHWHVIPRHVNDPHFPNPTWGAQLRPLATRRYPNDWLTALQVHLQKTLRGRA